MKNILLSTFVACAVSFAACQSETEFEEFGDLDLTSLNLNINEKPLESVESSNSDKTLSRAATTKENYTVTITKVGADPAETTTWKYSEVPSVIRLKTGTYNLVAHSEKDPLEAAAWDTPFCYGEINNIVVSKDKVTNAGELNCTLQSIKVNVVYTQKLKDLMDSEAKTVVTVNEKNLEYKKEETKSGYFYRTAKDNSTVAFTFTAKINGEAITNVMTKDQVKDGTELIMTYDYNISDDKPVMQGTMTANGIIVDESCTPVKENHTLKPDFEGVSKQ